MQPRMSLMLSTLAQLKPLCGMLRQTHFVLASSGMLCTHMDKIRLSFGPEVPFDGGRTIHLTPLLAGDAAQFEAPACHRLCVGVHLCTGSMTLIHCLQMRHSLYSGSTPCGDM